MSQGVNLYLGYVSVRIMITAPSFLQVHMIWRPNITVPLYPYGAKLRSPFLVSFMY